MTTRSGRFDMRHRETRRASMTPVRPGADLRAALTIDPDGRNLTAAEGLPVTGEPSAELQARLVVTP